LLRRRLGDERRAGARRPLRADPRLRRLRRARGVGRHVESGLAFLHFSGDAGYDFVEGYVGVLAERWSARVHLAPDYFGRDVSTVYAELDGHAVLDEHFRVFGHAGAIVRIAGDGAARAAAAPTCASASAGSMRGLDLQLAWIAASRGGPYPAVYDKPPQRLGRERVVLVLTRAGEGR
jgi:hypothetical protein